MKKISLPRSVLDANLFDSFSLASKLKLNLDNCGVSWAARLRGKSFCVVFFMFIRFEAINKEDSAN